MFASRFWSPGYNSGLETLFSKLHQGVVENNELLALVQARRDAEEAHGAKLAQIAHNLEPKKNGFAKDDGATMRKAYEGMVTQMRDEGKYHTHISESITQMVLNPFEVWASNHSIRIEKSQTELQKLIKAHERELAAAHRAQHRYFNRCRLEEDNDAESDSSGTTQSDGERSFRASPDNSKGDVIENRRLRSVSDSQASNSTLAKSAVTTEELVLADHHYSAEESQMLVSRMLREIPQKPTKVALLGTYEHTITGSDLVDWLRSNTKASLLSTAETAGQKLVNDGFLRLIGQFGSRFVNSSVFVYQWRPRAFEFAGQSVAAETSQPAGMYADFTNRWASDDVTSTSTKELDQKYRKSVAILDKARMNLEATMFEHFHYLERCERERLVAFKAVILDFSAAISNVIPAMSSTVSQLLLYHEIADVDRDLRFIVENYQTGHYDPKVVVYDNYYSSVDGAAIFGLDLDLRARADKKRVPLIVSCCLSALDSAYPLMDNDEARLSAWQVPLHANIRPTQEARQFLSAPLISTSQMREYLSSLPAVTIVQTLKLYFLELPSSVINGTVYDLLRGIYAKFSGTDEKKVEARIQSLVNTISQLTLSHIAVLDAITAHILRLVTISNASTEDMDRIAQQWGPPLCRPKNPTALSLDDIFPTQILRDLLDHRDEIFGELKRHAVSVSPQGSVSSNGSRFRSLSEIRMRSGSDSLNTNRVRSDSDSLYTHRVRSDSDSFHSNKKLPDSHSSPEPTRLSATTAKYSELAKFSEPSTFSEPIKFTGPSESTDGTGFTGSAKTSEPIMDSTIPMGTSRARNHTMNDMTPSLTESSALADSTASLSLTEQKAPSLYQTISQNIDSIQQAFSDQELTSEVDHPHQ